MARMIRRMGRGSLDLSAPLQSAGRAGRANSWPSPDAAPRWNRPGPDKRSLGERVSKNRAIPVALRNSFISRPHADRQSHGDLLSAPASVSVTDTNPPSMRHRPPSGLPRPRRIVTHDWSAGSRSNLSSTAGAATAKNVGASANWSARSGGRWMSEFVTRGRAVRVWSKVDCRAGRRPSGPL